MALEYDLVFCINTYEPMHDHFFAIHFFFAYTSGHCFQTLGEAVSRMQLQSNNLEGSDRALQASSGNLGDSTQIDASIQNGTSSSKQLMGRGVDVENPIAGKCSRSKERPVKRQSKALQSSNYGGDLPVSARPELQSARYLEYRQKQKKPKHTKGRPQVWTDELEEAFQDGMSGPCSFVIMPFF
jgi:hypothetical protein